MQVALFIIPLIVIIGWGMHIDDMTLSFDIFQVVVMFVAILLVNYLIGDGKSHWLEGMLLMCLYLIIAVCSWCRLPADQFSHRDPCVLTTSTSQGIPRPMALPRKRFPHVQGFFLP